MTPPQKIVLFAEGSLGQRTRHGDPFAKLWRELLVRELELLPIAGVVPIDKRALVAMDPNSPAMSGASVGLDELILREIEGDGIDVALGPGCECLPVEGMPESLPAPVEERRAPGKLAGQCGLTLRGASGAPESQRPCRST